MPIPFDKSGLNRSSAYNLRTLADANPVMSQLYLSLMNFALLVQTDGVNSEERMTLARVGELLHDVGNSKHGAVEQLCSITSELLLSVLTVAQISHWCVSPEFPEHFSPPVHPSNLKIFVESNAAKNKAAEMVPMDLDTTDSTKASEQVLYFPQPPWMADSISPRKGAEDADGKKSNGFGPNTHLLTVKQRLGDSDDCHKEVSPRPVRADSSSSIYSGSDKQVNRTLVEALGLDAAELEDMVRRVSKNQDPNGVAAGLQDTLMKRLSGLHDPAEGWGMKGSQPSSLATRSNDLGGKSTVFSRKNSLNSIEEWQEILMGIFWELDSDDSGDLSNMELRTALTAVGVTPARSMKMLQLIDKDGDGNISQAEWEEVIKALGHKDAPVLIKDFMKALLKHISRYGGVYKDKEAKAPPCFLMYNSKIRVFWDVLMTFFLFYVAVAVPFTLAFENRLPRTTARGLTRVELFLDCFFMVDIILNFRTSYVNSDGKHITDPRKVATHYVRTWFLVDFISSAPVDTILVALPDLNWIKLLKLGKIAKALKVLRIGRVFRRVDLFEVLDEFVNGSTLAMKIISLAVTTACVCHWMACFFVSFGGEDAFRDYFNVIESIERQYLASLYWAFSTMTTVGYGDVIPKSDGERLFACFAMIVGGSFYGYIIGCITSLVSTKDANLRAYHEKMNLVQAWLAYHSELPPNLVRRIRRHFKDLLTSKTAIHDSEILNDLSPDLRCDVSSFIIHDDVRYNVLFEDLPSTALALLVPSLQTTSVEVNEAVVRENEPGVAMFIILAGEGYYTSIADDISRLVSVGDSFGEEVILALELRYQYTVTATSKMNLHMIPSQAFNDCFQAMPDLVSQMRNNFLKARDFTLSKKEGTGRKSQTHMPLHPAPRGLLQSNFGGSPSLESLNSSMEELLSMVDKVLHSVQHSQVFNTGDKVRVTKESRTNGRTGVVINPDWHTLVKVFMDEDDEKGRIKTFKSTELASLQEEWLV